MQRYPWLVWLSVALSGGMWLGGVSRVDSSPNERIRSSASELERLEFGWGRGQVWDVPPDRLVTIRYAEVSGHIRESSEQWLSRMLQPDALPQKAADVITRYYLAKPTGDRHDWTFKPGGEGINDLLEFRWTFSGSKIRLVQSVNAIQVDVPLVRAPMEQRVAAARELVSRVVKLPGQPLAGPDHRVNLAWPSELRNGVYFSSNPRQAIQTQEDWSQRVDAFVQGDTLSLLLYKRIPNHPGCLRGAGWIAGAWPHARGVDSHSSQSHFGRRPK